MLYTLLLVLLILALFGGLGWRGVGGPHYWTVGSPLVIIIIIVLILALR